MLWTINSYSDLMEGNHYNEDGEREMMEVHYLQARNERGDVYNGPTILSHHAGFPSTYAPKVAAAVAEFIAANPNFDPTKAENWCIGFPVYGSEAWDSNAEYDLACFEADAFNEPRPEF